MRPRRLPGEICDTDLPVPEGDDLAELADSWNRMADQLEIRIQSVLSQNHQQEAVLASMIEGFLAVDNDQRVISVNNAAARLLGKPLGEVQGPKLARGHSERRPEASSSPTR